MLCEFGGLSDIKGVAEDLQCVAGESSHVGCLNDPVSAEGPLAL